MTTILHKRDVEHVKYLRPGDYLRVLTEDTWVVYKCPKCGFVTSIGRKYHAIDYEGAVSPAVNCPHTLGGGSRCQFSATIGLEDWIPEAKGSA